MFQGNVLSGYTDKSLTNARGVLILSPSTTIQALPDEGSRRFIFAVSTENNKKWYVCCDSFFLSFVLSGYAYSCSMI